jgi:hypothetical protein
MLAGCFLVAAALAPVERADQALGRGAYLEAVDILRAAAFPASGAPDADARAAWLQTHPFIGGTFDPAALGEPYTGPISPEVSDRFSRAEVRDAIREIVARAARTNIVIINEAHTMPRDRAFALEVARALRPLGYNILAAETFANHPGRDGTPLDERLARDGYARLDTGYFTLDPVFGDFVRQALAMGYRPVAYESTNHRPDLPMHEQIAAREQEQAENLVERIFRGNAHAKVLIHVGYHHVLEAPFDGGDGRAEEWMAARLKRLTGIDPLTIEQTLFNETVPTMVAHRNLLAPRMGRRPVVLYLDGRPLVEAFPPGSVDLQVIHPPLRLVRGRPDWLWRIGRRPVRVPRALLPGAGRRLIQAFRASEAADAVPLDQIVVEAGRPPPPVLVPRRTRIRWAYQDPLPTG